MTGIWALGDYALMAKEVMAPLGPVLVAARHGQRPESARARERAAYRRALDLLAAVLGPVAEHLGPIPFGQ